MTLSQKIAAYRHHAAEAARLAAEIEEALLPRYVDLVTDRPALSRVVDLVAQDYRITAPAILSRSKQYHIAEPRQVAIAICRGLSLGSCEQIARYFRRDHTTVSYSVSIVGNRLSTDPVFANRYNRLLEQCRAAITNVAA